jgi:hypothetical protein
MARLDPAGVPVAASGANLGHVNIARVFYELGWSGTVLAWFSSRGA